MTDLNSELCDVFREMNTVIDQKAACRDAGNAQTLKVLNRRFNNLYLEARAICERYDQEGEAKE